MDLARNAIWSIVSILTIESDSGVSAIKIVQGIF